MDIAHSHKAGVDIAHSHKAEVDIAHSHNAGVDNGDCLGSRSTFGSSAETRSIKPEE